MSIKRPFSLDDVKEEKEVQNPIPDISSNNSQRSNGYYGENTLASVDPALLANLENLEIEKDKNRKQEVGESEKTASSFSKVTVEIPLVLSSSQSPTIPRLQLSENARLFVHSHVPPSYPEGRFSASASGNCRIKQAIGASNGSFEATYKASQSAQVIGGVDITSDANTRPLSVHVGVQFKESNQSTIQVTAKQQGRNSWGISLSMRDVMDPWITSSRFSIGSNQWKTMCELSSMTTHVVRLGLAFTSNSADRTSTALISSYFPIYLLHLTIDPKISSVRRSPLSIQYNLLRGTWNASAAVQTSRHTKNATTKKSQSKGKNISTAPLSWRVGIQRGLSRWSVIIAWQQGDVTLRVPIVLGAIAGVSSVADTDSALASSATAFVVCAVVGVAQEMIWKFVWGDSNENRSSSGIPTADATANVETIAKAQRDARAQQTLMERQAEARTATETKKRGLIIKKAFYRLGNISWDVTTPLQFWVSTETSTLFLSAGPKQHLLGFYSLSSNSRITANATKEGGSDPGNQPRIPWWQEFYTPTKHRTRQASSESVAIEPMPTLSVQYSWQGKSFDHTIGDDQALSLPHLDGGPNLKGKGTNT